MAITQLSARPSVKQNFGVPNENVPVILRYAISEIISTTGDERVHTNLLARDICFLHWGRNAERKEQRYSDLEKNPR